MKSHPPLLAILLVGLSFLPGPPDAHLHAADPSPAHLIKQDAWAVIYLPDLAGLREAWAAGTMQRLLDEPEMRHFLTQLSSADELPWDSLFKQWTDHSIEDLLPLFPGAVAVSFYFDDAIPVEEWSDSPLIDLTIKVQEDSVAVRRSLILRDQLPAPPTVFVAYIGKNHEAMETFMARDLALAQQREEIESATEEYLGTTIHLRKEAVDGEWDVFEAWAIADEYFIYAHTESALRDMIAQVTHPDPTPDTPPHWQANIDRISTGQFFVYLHVKALEPLWMDDFIQGMDVLFRQSPFPLDARQILKALNITSFESCALNLDIQPDRLRLGFSGILNQPSGIWSLAAYTDEPLPTPAFASPEYLRSGVASFSFVQFYDALFTILKTASPSIATMIETQLDGFQNIIGLNIRNDLLAPIADGQWFSETFRGTLSPDAQLDEQDLESDVAMALYLRDQQRLESGLNTLRNFLGQGLAFFETREFLGTTIYSTKITLPANLVPVEPSEEESPTPMPAPEISYAITDGLLLLGFGSNQALERLLTDINDPGPTIWDLPEVRAALASFPTQPQGFEYSNMTRFIRMLYPWLQQWLQETDDLLIPLDPHALPSPDTLIRHLHSATTLTFWDADGFHSIIDFYGEKP